MSRRSSSVNCAVCVLIFRNIISRSNRNFSDFISARDEVSKSKKTYGSGRETLRLRANKPAVFEDVVENREMNKVMEKINVLLESFMGIFDNELATQIWEIGKTTKNPHDFVMAIESSDLEIFKFNEDLLFDIWGVISDSKLVE